MLFYTVENNHVILNDGYSDFNGNKYINNKKKKLNHKYYVYSRDTEKPVYIEKIEKMTIIDVIKMDEFQIVFYIDSHNRLSFIKAKYHKVLSVQDMVDKIEKTPFFVVNVFSLFKALIFFGILRFRSYSFEEVNLSLGYDKSINVKVHYLFPERLRSKYSMRTSKPFLFIHLFWCKIPFNVLYQHYIKNSDINIPVFIKVINEQFDYYYNLKMNSKDKYDKKHYIYNTSSYAINKTSIEFFIRKSVTGQFVVVFTSVLQKKVVLIEWVAFIFSLIARSNSKYNVYFEKFCEGASESAFELFKYAEKYDENAVFILSGEHQSFNKLVAQYPNKVFAKNSFKAFYVIFLAKSFISSDLVSHIQRRLYDNDTLIKKKILSNNNKIFLQHGVCLATNVFERGYYNTKVPIAPDYIVVNSKFEKKMFEENTNYKSRQLIETGLPNMDLYANTRNDKKEQITFLLTWRPWDLTAKIEKGSYLHRYKQFIELVSNHSFYDDKIVNIVLHPKARVILEEQFPEFYEENKGLFYEGDIKDALIKSKVLISDYSSVTFFGFAGGSNIIFYWEDKEIAERNYGAPNILQKERAFGDIIYNFDLIHNAIEKNYFMDQVTTYKEIFDTLVEYKDGFNTKETFRFINNILKTSKKGKSNEFALEDIGGI